MAITDAFMHIYHHKEQVVHKKIESVHHVEENSTRSGKVVPKAWAAKEAVIVKELIGIQGKPHSLLS